ncbi:histidine kinase [Cyclobacterium sp.]|uniref:sensor histidine kinase n=1 Tax=Cyclobacterium sp. TaxID=1966343 RepID=UPI0019C54711|nr:histidine kinase [Cyclobacterium sp.]MBD3631153.1 histidine kinase [Cyclobacterium sp.]
MQANPTTKPYEETTWNVIRERLFNGENANAYRFEEDIRLQVIGLKTQQDSLIITRMISELNGLLETVKIKMVNENPNFKLTLMQEPGGISSNNWKRTSGSKIVFVNLDIGIPDLTDTIPANVIYFHTIRNLTKLFMPQQGETGYGGIFDSSDASKAEFKEIDKDLLKKLYSSDFYEKLKKSTVEKFGYQYYLDLRYQKLTSNLSYFLKAILILFGFLFFLSKESKRKKNPSLLMYIKQRAIILFILPFFHTIVTTSEGSLSFLVSSPGAFIANIMGTVLQALLVLVFLYYTEPVFVKKLDNFVGKQAFIFLSTLFAGLIVPIILVFPYLLIFYPNLISSLTFSTFLLPNTTYFFLIASVATLRVFYNFVNYRIQSMVNQKDVEIAKMKELKNQAELNAIHSRINPHFLYNSLNSIASLAHIDAGKTEDMATGLSELFRYSINKENKNYVSVAEELDMVKNYLEIEKTRFGDNLEYEINADENTLEKQIPKFLIQPLVENAVKHGVSQIKAKGKIVVVVKQHKKELWISIYDNGPDFPEEPVSGYGLQNLNDKLEIIYGNNAHINWENGANKHFKVTLKNQFNS